MLNARLLRLDDQTHQHAHDYHQLVMSLAGRAEFEVNGSGGEVCRMRACLVPGMPIMVSPAWATTAC